MERSAPRHKITILHIFSGDLWAGAEVMIFNLLSALKENPDLRLLALSLNEGTLSGKLRDAGIETHVVSEISNIFVGIYIKALGIYYKEKINIIHSHRYKENLLALMLAKSIGVKKLYSTIHGLPEQPPHETTNKSKLFRFITRTNYYLLDSFFDRTIAVSHEMKDALIRQDIIRREKISVIHNGIPVPPAAILSHEPHERAFHIGTVGRMVPVKDYNLFLEAASEIRKRSNHVRFSILGDGPLKAQLIRRSQELELNDLIDFLPSRPDVLPYYESLDLYLNTSRHEGMPLSILEAMACGKAVLAPKVGGINEIIVHGENGFLLEDRNAAKIADQCLSLMKDRDAIATVGRDAAESIACRFSDFKMASSYLDLYLNGDIKE